ncbi:hypothetical protein E4U10_003866 [Claviceps purpurea]|nr:hypothetical protein E4U10_003866 [Claviceps purpurea]
MLVLSNFATGDRKQSRDNPFRCFKDEKSLVSYFQRMKKLLVFFSRVAYREGGHFTVRAETDAETVSPTSERQEYPQLPQDIIRPTDDQRSMEPQNSPVLSFCAMLSRKKAHAGHRSKECARPSRKELGDDERDDAEQQRLNTGGWQEAGNYNSNLSKLIWMAQLLIFESVYHHHVNNVDDTITNQLKKLCEKFLHQAQDTVFARILSWRLYLTKVSKGAVASNQARCSSDGREITYLGTTLSM